VPTVTNKKINDYIIDISEYIYEHFFCALFVENNDAQFLGKWFLFTIAAL